MFSKPEHGWTTVKIGDHYLGSASYIYQVITPTLSILYDYLSKSSYENQSLNLVFDAEGYSFGIVQIDDEFYSWSNENGKIELKELLNKDNDNAYDWIKTLTNEIINDVESNWDDWVAFECTRFTSEFIDEDDKELYRETEVDLAELIENIKNLKPQKMPELGNLLWGHSYGEYPIEDREKFQEKFQELLDMGFDSYGSVVDDDLEYNYMQILTSKFTNADIYSEDSVYVKNSPDYHPHIHYFDNGIFMINPYYWGDAEDLMEFPNFIYYEDNIKIRWYKYPFRDSYMSKKLSYEEFCNIIDKCKQSLL